MTEEELRKNLLDLIILIVGAVSESGIEALKLRLTKLKKEYGPVGLKNILNTLREDSKSGFSALDYSESDEASKQLLINGAIPFKKQHLSVICGKLIIANIQQKKGESFSPVFVEYNTGSTSHQLKLLHAYLQFMHDNLEENENAIKINKTFILSTDGHWLCCHMEFSKNLNTKPMLQMFFIDSLGLKYWKHELSMLCKKAQSIFRTANIYRSTLELQIDSGCKIFTLIFTRMLYSLLAGKFKKANPEYDLFKELALINSNKEPLIKVLKPRFTSTSESSPDNYSYASSSPDFEDVLVINLENLPAKFLQLTQKSYEQSTNLAGTLKIDPNAITNSRGSKLEAVILENTKDVIFERNGEKICEMRNTKLATKFEVMQKMILNSFPLDQSDENKLTRLNSIVQQFSTDVLPKSAQKPALR